MLGVFQQPESRSERKIADKVKTKVGDPFIKVFGGRPSVILYVFADLAEEDLHIVVNVLFLGAQRTL